MMTDGAIDFRKMLLEEKEKARRKALPGMKQSEQDKPAGVAAKIVADPLQRETNSNPASFLDRRMNREDDVEAIDFDQLKEKLLQEQIMAESWSLPLVFDRHRHRVCSDPPSIYYVADFMPRESDRRQLMAWLRQIPENPHSSKTQDPAKANAAWTALQYAKRRVAMFDDLLAPAPAPLALVSKALLEQGIFPSYQPPNHILVNEYHPGQGILPHTDGPAYESRTATLSLGSDVLIQFTPRPNHDDPPSDEVSTHKQLWLQNGGLLVFEDAAYLDYCHGIDDRVLEEQASEGCLNSAPGHPIQREYRISLTFRHKKQHKT